MHANSIDIIIIIIITAFVAYGGYECQWKLVLYELHLPNLFKLNEIELRS